MTDPTASCLAAAAETGWAADEKEPHPIQIIAAQDKPRAEIVVDVEILEFSRDRARQYGLDLSQHAVGAVFSPAGSPSSGGDASAADLTAPPFNVNTVTRGVSPADRGGHQHHPAGDLF